MGIIWACGFVPAWACHGLGPQPHFCLFLLPRHEDLVFFWSLGYRPVQINLMRQLPLGSCFGSWSSEITTPNLCPSGSSLWPGVHRRSVSQSTHQKAAVSPCSPSLGHLVWPSWEAIGPHTLITPLPWDVCAHSCLHLSVHIRLCPSPLSPFSRAPLPPSPSSPEDKAGGWDPERMPPIYFLRGG